MTSASRHSVTEQTPFTEDMAVLAKRLSDSAITKGNTMQNFRHFKPSFYHFTFVGQIEVLQHSLAEAENLIKELKGNLQPVTVLQ